MTAPETYDLTVNGTEHHVADAWLGESLLYVLRERLGLPGAKNACEQGECGSCSVLVDGTPRLLVPGPRRHRGRHRGHHRRGASPSTACSPTCSRPSSTPAPCSAASAPPAWSMAVDDLLDRDAAPTELEIREAISGNLCRCTGYGRVIEAVRVAVRRRSGAEVA